MLSPIPLWHPVLQPFATPPDRDEVLRAQARRLFDALLPAADRETLQLLVPFLGRLSGVPGPNR